MYMHIQLSKHSKWAYCFVHDTQYSKRYVYNFCQILPTKKTKHKGGNLHCNWMRIMQQQEVYYKEWNVTFLKLCE